LCLYYRAANGSPSEEGCSSTIAQVIAKRLHLSPKTINNIHYQIKAKFGVRNDFELTRMVLSWGLITAGIAGSY
jgi:DNA-binding NarL/FixJ family response regulator